MKVFIGWDSREPLAFEAAERSLKRHSPSVTPTPLCLDKLAAFGLLRRPMDRRGGMYDFPSNAPCSTEFAISRFLVPMLAQSGWALFVDADVVFLADVAELFALADPTKAVMVVDHGDAQARPLTEVRKMDGQIQTRYPRKNQSSVMLWNCDHVANQRLTLRDVNERRGFDLHQFYWLNDSEIGYLPGEWNWLVNVEPKPDQPKLAHYTLGIPAMVGDDEHSHYWREALTCPL